MGIIILLSVVLILGLILWGSIKFGISPMPTSPAVKKQLLATLPNDLKGNIYELGAGWGTLAFPLAKKYPDAQIIAIEGSWIPYIACRIFYYFYPYSNLTFRCVDFFSIKLDHPHLIICYLYKDAMEKLKDKFINEADAETLIVSHTFAINGWKPIYILKVNDLYNTPIYHYKAIMKDENH